MYAEADRLHRHVQQTYFTSTENWGDVNVGLPDGQQLESVVNEMVDTHFGGYNRNSTLTIGSSLYYCRARPAQNKFSREKKAYGDHNFEGAASYVNIIVHRARNGETVLNIHILLRTLAAEKRIQKRIASSTPDEDGWCTVGGR